MKPMTQSSSNNQSAWRTRIDSLEATPGTDSWQLLSDRISEHKPVKKVFWYSVAAAITVGCILLSAIIFNGRQEEQSMVKSKASSMPLSVPHVNKKEIPIVNSAPIIK